MRLVALVKEWAQRKNTTPAQFALIWMLSRKSWIAPIPGTTNPAHLDDFLGAGTIRLSSWEMEEFDRDYAKIDLLGHRADPFTESQIDKEISDVSSLSVSTAAGNRTILPPQ